MDEGSFSIHVEVSTHSDNSPRGGFSESNAQGDST